MSTFGSPQSDDGMVLGHHPTLDRKILIPVWWHEWHYTRSARRRCSRKIDSSTERKNFISARLLHRTIKDIPAPSVTAVDFVSYKNRCIWTSMLFQRGRNTNYDGGKMNIERLGGRRILASDFFEVLLEVWVFEDMGSRLRGGRAFTHSELQWGDHLRDCDNSAQNLGCVYLVGVWLEGGHIC